MSQDANSRFQMQCPGGWGSTSLIYSFFHWHEYFDVREVEEGRTLEVRARHLVEHVRRARVLRQRVAAHPVLGRAALSCVRRAERAAKKVRVKVRVMIR